MNEHERIDLSPLEPVRWEARLEATLLRLDPLLEARRRPDPLTLIAQWSRAVIFAAAAALALLIPVELLLEARETREAQVRRLVSLSATVGGGSAPSTAEFLRALGEGGEPR